MSNKRRGNTSSKKNASTQSYNPLEYRQVKRKPRNNTTTQGNTKVLFNNVLHLYRFNKTKNNYDNLGRKGVLIAELPSKNQFNLILYIDQQQQLSSSFLTKDFQLVIQKDNFINYNDDKQQNWSINFPNQEILDQFISQIGVSKLINTHHQLSTNKVLTVDIKLGQGDPVSDGSWVQVKYRGWLFDRAPQYKLGRVFDSNHHKDGFRFQIGANKVIRGWSHGISGMCKEGKRILVIPPSLGYGSNGSGQIIPPNAFLVFSIHLEKIKQATSVSTQSQNKKKTSNEETSQQKDKKNESNTNNEENKTIVQNKTSQKDLEEKEPNEENEDQTNNIENEKENLENENNQESEKKILINQKNSKAKYTFPFNEIWTCDTISIIKYGQKKK